MNKKLSIRYFIIILAAVTFPSAMIFSMEQKPVTILFDFSDAKVHQPWVSNNDGVMGGLSKGGAEMTETGMSFSGILSLENNGGFSSIQNRVELDLSEFKGIRLKVRGDGRTYQLRLNSDARFRLIWPVSFSREFRTQPSEWLEVDIPFSQLRQSWRGRTLSGHTFNPSKIEMMGVLLGDKQSGPFKLEIAWIGAYR